MKDESDRKILKNIVGLRAQPYGYLIDDSSENKNARGRKKCIIKIKLKFEDHKNCLEEN